MYPSFPAISLRYFRLACDWSMPSIECNALRVGAVWPPREASIIMSQPIDLGHSTFQATGSALELQFGAIANLSQLGSRGISSSTIKINHWKDLQSMWITEAPELELRIFVNADPVIEAVGPTFVANVEEELCNSKV